MKSLIILTLAFSIVSCGRTNPQKKINEETKKATDALKAKTDKEMSALKESDEKKLNEEIAKHKKDNEKNHKFHEDDEKRIAGLNGMVTALNKISASQKAEIKKVNADLESQAKLTKSAKDLIAKHEAKIAELQKQLDDLESKPVVENKDEKEDKESKEDNSALEDKVSELEKQLEDAKAINNVNIISHNSSPSDLLGNIGDCFETKLEGEEVQKWKKSEEKNWMELEEGDEEICNELQKVTLVNEIQFPINEKEEETEDIDSQESNDEQQERPVITSSQAKTVMN